MAILVERIVTYPSKWDIIPIHASDRGTFKFCRRQYGWSSPAKLNLTPKASVYGVREPLWFGTGIHYALQKFYDPILSQDPVTTWLAWFDLQWEGGYVPFERLPEFIDRFPVLTEVGIYKVEGLSTILPYMDNEVEEKFLNYRDMGRGMMEFYKNYAATYDNFEVIAVEHEFSVPIFKPNTTTNEVLYMPDYRTMPEDYEPDYETENKYGPLTRKIATAPYYLKQVHARGRQDMIIRETEFGTYGIRDFKTAASVDEDYFRHLELDEQCTTYLWAGEIEADLFDLPYKKLEFIDYVALLKGYPVAPTITSRGVPSINRKEEKTTARLFEQTIELLGGAGKAWFEATPAAQSYYQWMLEMGDKRFIWPKRERRNRIQRENMGIRVYYEALDMLDPNLKLYPNPTRNYSCINCVFRAPCIAAETGADYKAMIAEGYMPNWDR